MRGARTSIVGHLRRYRCSVLEASDHVDQGAFPDACLADKKDVDFDFGLNRDNISRGPIDRITGTTYLPHCGYHKYLDVSGYCVQTGFGAPDVVKGVCGAQTWY